MYYIRRYNQAPKTVKWKYFDPTRRITSNQPLQATSIPPYFALRRSVRAALHRGRHGLVPVSKPRKLISLHRYRGINVSLLSASTYISH
jgi:hypothetical protein